MSRTILIKNGHIWSAHDDFIGDILVSDGKIAALGQNLETGHPVDEVIDADGLYVIPGGIDPHTHLDLPFMGSFSADDFETGTLAGLHGGTTAVVDLAIQSKGGSLKDALKIWYEKAEGKAVADYTYHCGVTEITPSVKEEIPWVIKEEGITSFKVFMAYKGALMVEDDVLMDILQLTRNHGAFVAVHAENGHVVDALIEKCREAGTMEPQHHLVAHPAETETEAAGRIMDLAHPMKGQVYIVHTTCRGVLDRVYRNYSRDQRVLVETCPQYLLLDDSVYYKPGFEGAKYVMSPPIRKKDDQEALWFALQAGLVQTVGTDHCPFNYVGQKEMGKDDFSKIPNGAAGIQHRMELMFSEGVVKNRITMNRYVEVMSTNVASIFGLHSKGSLTVGKDADIVLFDPNEKHIISAETHKHNVDNSIYEGWEVTGKVKSVLSNGRIAIRDGKADEIEKGQGRRLKRKPYNYSF